MQHLQRRGGGWYYRCRYPVDLTEQLRTNKAEIKISPRVRRYSTAKRLVKVLDHHAEEVFTQLRRNRMTLPLPQLQRIVTDHSKKVLEDAEEARLSGGSLLPSHGEGDDDPLEGLELHLSGLVEDLAGGR